MGLYVNNTYEVKMFQWSKRLIRLCQLNLDDLTLN